MKGFDLAWRFMAYQARYHIAQCAFGNCARAHPRSARYESVMLCGLLAHLPTVSHSQPCPDFTPAIIMDDCFRLRGSRYTVKVRHAKLLEVAH